MSTARANLLMAAAGLAALVAVNLLHVGCGVPPNDVATAEAEVVSTDPCGVQIAPYAPACTKPGKTSWRCTSYNSTTHRCQRAEGTTPIPGTYFVSSNPPPPVFPAIVLVWPGWEEDDLLAPYPSGGPTYAVQLVPAGLAVPAFSTILTAGWSYASADLTPSGFAGLQAMRWNYIEVRGGAGICIYAAVNYTGQLGCWSVPTGGQTLVLEPPAWGNGTVRSFFTFGV